MLERDGLGECIGDAKVEIGVDIRVEIDFALFGELHNGRPGEGLGVGSNAKHGLFGIDRDAVFNVFVAVALGKEQFAILDDRDGCTGDVVFLHRRRKKSSRKVSSSAGSVGPCADVGAIDTLPPDTTGFGCATAGATIDNSIARAIMTIGYRQRLLKGKRLFAPLLFNCDHRISGLTTGLVIGVPPPTSLTRLNRRNQRLRDNPTCPVPPASPPPHEWREALFRSIGRTQLPSGGPRGRRVSRRCRR